MARVLLLLVAVGLGIYALLDIGRTPHTQTRTMPKVLWFVVALVPLLGPVLWLVAGRPRRAGAGGATGSPSPLRPRRRGPVAPDDDPEFLRRIADEAWAKRMEEQRRARGGGHAAEPGPTVPGAPPAPAGPPAAASNPPSGPPAAGEPGPRTGQDAAGPDEAGHA